VCVVVASKRKQARKDRRNGPRHLWRPRRQGHLRNGRQLLWKEVEITKDGGVLSSYVSSPFMASSSSWMPFHGVHQVNIGTSLRRSLKARKNNGEPSAAAAATQRSKRLPDRDFYAFRCQYKVSKFTSNLSSMSHILQIISNPTLSTQRSLAALTCARPLTRL
jgi:hypothetical protein